MRAFSSASQVNSSAIRCCGSMLSASIFDSAKNSASKPLMSDRYPPRVRALATRSAIRGSSRNSSQRPSGRSVIASRPSSSACHVSSGVFMSPGNRVAMPTIAMSSTSRSRDQSSPLSDMSISGSPSTMTVASDSMVGWRNATVAVSVTPVRSSMSLAIATASRDDRPSSTIGVDSLIASADWPVAVAIQLRSHSRISATVMSVRGGARAFSGASWMSGSNSPGGWESSCLSVIFPPPSMDYAPVVRWSFRLSRELVRLVGEIVRDLAAAQAAVQVGGAAGAAADLAAGGPRDRTGGREEHVAHRHTVAHGDRGANVVGDRSHVELVRPRCALANDHQLLGAVVGIALETGVRILKHLVGQLICRHREGRDIPDPQRLCRLLRRVLQVLRVVVAPVDDDEILHAAGDEQLAVVVGAEVTGAHPRRVVGCALGVRRVGPRLQDVMKSFCRFVLFAPVASAHVLPTDPDVADLSVGQLRSGLRVDDDGPLGDADLACTS